jgi:putative membrane protein
LERRLRQVQLDDRLDLPLQAVLREDSQEIDGGRAAEGQLRGLGEKTVSSEAWNGKPSLWKGLAAGVVAGLVATAAKSLAEKLYPPRIHGEPEPPELLSERVAGHPLDEQTETIASEAIHWGFGAAAGGFYGALAEFYPAATSEDGASFGLALMALTHQGALPALELSAPPEEQSERERTSEAATHILYGIVAERVRSLVRRLLD